MKRKFMSSDDIQRYGFEWPECLDPPTKQDRACRIQVSRVAAIGRDNGTYRVLQVTTPVDQIAVYVSPTGRIRIFTDSKEWSK